MTDYTMMCLACDCNDNAERDKILDSLSEYGFDLYLDNYWWFEDGMWHLLDNEIASQFWVDLAKEFRFVSQRHPDVHFEVEIKNGAYWCNYVKIHYLGGKMQVCYGTMNYDPFDPELLN